MKNQRFVQRSVDILNKLAILEEHVMIVMTDTDACAEISMMYRNIVIAACGSDFARNMEHISVAEKHLVEQT